MGILSRTINVVRSNLNSLLNRAEDPTKMLEQTLLDMQNAFEKAKDKVGQAMAGKTKLEKSLLDEQREAKKWKERAMRAVEEGNDELAREALQRKQEYTQRTAEFQHEMEAHAANVDQLRSELHSLQDKIAEIKRKKNLLISKQERAEAQSQIYKTIDGIGSSSAIDTIERMENKIEEMSHLADARMELSEEFQGDQLERKFKELGAG
ncbi:MAG: PspA/IM30 family protein, partial [SAR324 cluster bacterium]|nr:PspA/IM30 family protein [SAR324 cluster bacterium]